MSAIHLIRKGDQPDRNNYPLLRKIIRAVLKTEGLDPRKSELTVVFTTDDELKQLNEFFRQLEGPTDVLSFPADDLDPESGLKYLGDIVISMDQVKKQHAQFADSENDILCLLIVHGTLHLLGFDHANGNEKEIMWHKQDLILSQFGIKVHIPE